MEIPYEKLSADVLQMLIEEFVLHEGTDYGHAEHTLEEKVEAVKQQLEQGRVKIVFNPDDESCFIVRADA